MLHLPPYNEVKHFEGKGNYAISKYYFWPWRWFYRHKLLMILRSLQGLYYRALDYGSGPAKILNISLSKCCASVTSVNEGDTINPLWRFNLVVCSSVLEFVDLRYATYMFHNILCPKGEIVIASPMDTWVTRFYFKCIGDKHKRNSHKDIFKAISSSFDVVSYEEWLGIYFCLKVKKR